MLDEMCATLGGRAAEKVIFNEISTGALNDLEKVTKQARAMVTVYGLSEKVGNISYYDSSGQQSGFTKPYSEERAQTIDKEVSRIIEEAYIKAKEVLSENKEKLTLLAEALLEKEVIFKEDLERIFGRRPGSAEVEEAETVTPESEASSETEQEAPAETVAEESETEDKTSSETNTEDESKNSIV